MSRSASAHAAAAAAPAFHFEPADRHECQQLVDLVAKCKGETDDAYTRVLAHVKNFVRQSDLHATLAAELLLAKLHDQQASVRLNLMRVVDCLFMRSKAFRAAMLEQFNSLLELTVGIGPGASRCVPKPPLAKELQLHSIACVRTWNETYGDALKLLRIAHTYMQSRVGNLHAPSRLETEQAATSSRAIRRARTQQLLAVRYARLVGEFDSGMRELEGVLNEIDNSLEILFPQANQASFDAFLLSEEAEEVDEPPPKRLKSEAVLSAESGFAATAASNHATAASSAPVAAVTHAPELPTPAATVGDDSIEWETDPAPVSSSSSASRLPRKPLSSLITAATHPTPIAPSVDAAAAAFLENETSADSHWWLDEQPDDQEMEHDSSHDEDDEEGMKEDEEQKLPADEPHLVHGLGGRSYSLDIEFASNFGAIENDDNRVVFQSLRENWHRIQRSLLPMLNEWIDALTRIEFSDTVASSAATGSATPSAATQGAARDRYLLRSVEKRELLGALQKKCAKLGLPVSTLAADRSALVLRATERAIAEQEEEATPAKGAAPRHSSTTSAPPAPAPAAGVTSSSASSAADILAHTRHATRLASQRSNAAARATKKIKEVKRKYAKQLEQDRLERRDNPVAAAAHATAINLRRPFSTPSEGTNGASLRPGQEML